jgi:hypothetical protein
MTLKSLKDNKEIRILQADKGDCVVVLNESTYKEKISSLLMKFCVRIPRLRLRGRYGNFLLSTKLFFPQPRNLNWLLTAVNYFTSVDFPRYTNLASQSDQ